MMDCGSAREGIPAYVGGELDPVAAETLGSHLAGCDACMAEARHLPSTLALLKVLPDISPSPELWTRISDQLDPAPVAVRSFAGIRMLLKVAAAASIAVAAVSFLAVGVVSRALPAATVSFAMPGGVAPGTTLRSGDSFSASAYTVLTFPGVGSLKLDRGSTIRILSPRRVQLDSGELFAEITPDGRGFRITAPDAGVTVHGTRFGVKSDGAASTVYVLEGRVAVDSAGRSMELTNRQTATIGGPAKPLEDEALRWIAENEAPVVVIGVEGAPTRIARGDPLSLRISFRSTSPAPVLLDPLRELPGRLVLKISDPDGHEYVAGVEGTITPVAAQLGALGAVRVDVSSPCILDCRVTVGRGFDRAGRYTIGISHPGTGTPGAGPSVHPSEPFTLEVTER